MTMNILAILLSFAMMLTGAGVDGQPAEASRVLMLHDVSLTYNGETVDLAPTLALGAATDGEKAVLDVGVRLGDDVLFPMQLGVSEAGLTALLVKEDVAATLSAQAFEALEAQASQMMEGAISADGEDAELLQILTNDFIPAYTGLLEAAKDPEFQKQLQETGNAVLAEIVDRGEGTPVTELIEGETYELTAYSYTLDSAQLAELVDAVYSSNEKLSALYDALLKLYGAMPEESGLRGVTSFADIFERLNLDMTMDMDEKVSDDGLVEVTDAVLTMDMNAMIQRMAEAEHDAADEDDETPEIPRLDPIVAYIHGVKTEDVSDAEMSCEFEIEGVGMAMTMDAHSEGMTDVDLDMDFTMLQAGEVLGRMEIEVDADTDEATGDVVTSANYAMIIDEERVDFSLNATEHADGLMESRFAVEGDIDGQSFALSFALDVTADAVEDLANGHEAVAVIDEFSDEALNALGEDEAVQAAMMRVVGSLSGDAQKLMADESVQQLVQLFTAVVEQPYAYEDDSFDEVDDYDDFGEDYEDYEVEDDGELGFEVPEFTWLPEGWQVEDTDVDTAYDMVQMVLSDEANESYCYASFFANEDDSRMNYIVSDDGSISPVEGREVIVNDYGDGSVSVTFSQSGVDAYLNLYAEDADMELIGQLVAGLKF